MLLVPIGTRAGTAHRIDRAVPGPTRVVYAGPGREGRGQRHHDLTRRSKPATGRLPRSNRGSSANSLTSEFLGDYNYAVATNDFGAAVWIDVRNAAVCPAINAFRQSLVDGAPIARPRPQLDCDPQFGNTDTFGGTYAAPTP